MGYSIPTEKLKKLAQEWIRGLRYQQSGESGKAQYREGSQLVETKGRAYGRPERPGGIPHPAYLEKFLKGGA